MGTFTISQSPSTSDVWLYPDSDLADCTDLTAYGDNPNYKCVDEDRENPDDDSTYVYNNTSTLLFDLYGIPLRPNLSGSINYIQIYARAKSDIHPQSSTGIYKILISPDGTCTDTYASDDIDLITSYNTYQKVWKTNPSDGNDWNWGNIKLMKIGIECDSPTDTYTSYLTIRPDANGDVVQGGKTGCNVMYQCVDETEIDDGDTYTYTSGGVTGTTEKQLYQLDNHTTQSGVISNVSIFVATWTVNPDDTWIETLIKTGGTEYEGSTVSLATSTWQRFSTDYIINPQTGVAWTWADIDALQAGIKIHAGINRTVKCTQIYVVVESVESLNPEVRTTQCYIKINYTPEETTCNLNKPDEISLNHTRNIKMINFWSGNRVVYDLNRSGKSMVLKSIEWEDACKKIECIKNMVKNGAVVTIDGLGDSIWDGDYYIRSFGWRHVSEQPNVYEWILELEDTRYGTDAYG